MTSEPSDVTTTGLHRPAELEHLPVFLEYIRGIAQTVGLAEAQISRLELAAEEALVNVFSYAYAGQASPGSVGCQVVMRADGLTVEIVDEGPPFDPLVQPDPDTSLEIDQRQPGGLGVLLIKSLVEEVGYRREDGRNVLTLQVGGI